MIFESQAQQVEVGELTLNIIRKPEGKIAEIHLRERARRTAHDWRSRPNKDEGHRPPGPKTAERSGRPPTQNSAELAHPSKQGRAGCVTARETGKSAPPAQNRPVTQFLVYYINVNMGGKMTELLEGNIKEKSS